MGSSSEDEDFWAFEGQDENQDERSFERKCKFCGTDITAERAIRFTFCSSECEYKFTEFNSWPGDNLDHDLTFGIPYSVRKTYSVTVRTEEHLRCSFCGKCNEDVVDFQTNLQHGYMHSFFCMNAVCLPGYTRFFRCMESPHLQAPDVIKEFANAAEWYRVQCVARMFKPYAVQLENNKKRKSSSTQGEDVTPDSSSTL